VSRKPRLQHLIFNDDTAARTALENLRWPKGATCPHCASDAVARMGGAKQSHRDGLFRCNECRGQFTVTVGTIFHRSKVPLAKWMQIVHLEAAPSDVRKSWQMAQATGLTHKTVERMRARIYAAAGKYRGPNTIFGRRVSRYVRDQRPAGYQNPPKPRRDGDGLDYRPWYA
jgi:transposase-like protein